MKRQIGPTRQIDDYLVVRAQQGDRQAMSALVSRWHRKLLAHAWRLTNDLDLSAEAVQSAWIEILRSLNALRDEAAFGAFVFRIVTRQCARQLRGRIKARTLIAAVVAEPDLSFQSPTEGGPDAGKLRAAILQLSPPQRAAVALFYFEGLSVAETAVALDAPVGTIKTRLMHARRALGSILQGGDHDCPD